MVVATIPSDQRHRRRHVRSRAPDVTPQLPYHVARLGQNAHVLANMGSGRRLRPAMRLGVEHVVVRSQGGGVR